MSRSAREDRREEARERALALLYEAEAKSLSIPEVLAALPVEPAPLAVQLVLGVDADLATIDALLGAAAKGWSVARMASLDRAVLRLATYELLRRPDVPTAVILDQAVQLAKRYSTDDSGRFVNGVLAAVAREVRPGGRASR